LGQFEFFGPSLQTFALECRLGGSVPAGDVVALVERADFLIASLGLLRARSHCRFVLPRIRFIQDLLTYSVPLFLKRQCDGTLGLLRFVLAKAAATAPPAPPPPELGALLLDGEDEDDFRAELGYRSPGLAPSPRTLIILPSRPAPDYAHLPSRPAPLL
jgi:hypothetical protein